MPKFTEEQQQAIDREGENILVSAGAGSGKTAVLTERVLRKIKEVISIKQLLILTFTNKAAMEMKERIRKKLAKEHLQDQLDQIDSSYITTFDAFSSLPAEKKGHYFVFKLPVQDDVETMSFYKNGEESKKDIAFDPEVAFRITSNDVNFKVVLDNGQSYTFYFMDVVLK